MLAIRALERESVRGKLYMGFGSATVNDVNWRDKAATRWRQGTGEGEAIAGNQGRPRNKDPTCTCTEYRDVLRDAFGSMPI